MRRSASPALRPPVEARPVDRPEPARLVTWCGFCRSPGGRARGGGPGPRGTAQQPITSGVSCRSCKSDHLLSPVPQSCDTNRESATTHPPSLGDERRDRGRLPRDVPREPAARPRARGAVHGAQLRLPAAPWRWRRGGWARRDGWPCTRALQHGRGGVALVARVRRAAAGPAREGSAATRSRYVAVRVDVRR